MRSECDDRLGIGAADRSHGHIPRRLAAGVAHGAGLQPTCAEGVEETVHQAAVQLALMRAIGIAEECERPALGDDGLPACSDLVERCVPRNRGELALPFRPAPAQGGGEALRRMDKLGVTVDLGAGKPRREGLRGIAHHTHHAPALDLCEQRAHVGTIVRAHHPDRFHALPPRLPGERGRHCRGRRWHLKRYGKRASFERELRPLFKARRARPSPTLSTWRAAQLHFSDSSRYRLLHYRRKPVSIDQDRHCRRKERCRTCSGMGPGFRRDDGKITASTSSFEMCTSPSN